MSLKECRECGHRVSSKADHCPKCGIKNPTKNKTLNTILWVIAILFILGLLSNLGGNDGINSNADKFSTLLLNVRKGPSTDYDVVTALKPGEKVETVNDSAGWEQIKLIERDDKVTGWASEKYLKDIAKYDDWKYKQNEKKLGVESSEPNTTWKDEIDKVSAYVMVKGFVEDRLKAPSTAEFQGVWDGFDYDRNVTYLGNQTYTIRSYVDSENSFGAKIRNHFQAKIQQTGKDNWTLKSLNFQNQ